MQSPDCFRLIGARPPRCRRALLVLALAPMLGIGQLAEGNTVEKEPARDTVSAREEAEKAAQEQMVREMASRLAGHEDALLFPQGLREEPAGVDGAMVEELGPWAVGAGTQEALPETTYTLYRTFSRTGERRSFEQPYFKKRELLTREVLRVWLLNEEDRIDRVNDLIWSICEESYWVAPAHEGGPETIDLFSAETGADLATADALLGDRLPEEIRTRIRAEVKSRILDNYLENHAEYWWDRGRNNWTGVCAGAVGEAAMLLEEDPARLARILAPVRAQLERFIERGFEEDGGCLEGIGYWGYGLSHFIACAEMLRARTGGQVDLLSLEKLDAIARYPLAVSLDEGIYASFSDASSHAALQPFIAAAMAEASGARGLLSLRQDPRAWRLSFVLRNLAWRQPPQAEVERETLFMPISGIARLVGDWNGTSAALAIKAGHNAEPHNQNDVGSFVLCAAGEVLLCDPGPGLYSKAYFGPDRYENVFANSLGHSVPRIGGALQQPGPRFKGSMEPLGDNGALLRLEGAYGLDGLHKVERRVRLLDGGVELRDAFAFDSPGMPVEEALVTWCEVEADGPRVRVMGERGMLEISSPSGAFSVEHREEASKANRKSGVLKRITLDLAPAPELICTITMQYTAHAKNPE